jgi:sarcosine oxidase
MVARSKEKAMRVVVVGAGIAGLSSAWQLARRGHAVTLLEQGQVPNPLAASGDHHRIIRRAYGAASGYARAIDEAYAAWDELWNDLGASHHDPRGFMALSREPGDEAEAYLDGMVAGGWPVERFDGAEAERRFPFLNGSSIRFGFTSPEGGALHCRRIAAGMARWLRAAGAELRENARVEAVDAAAAIVTLADGEQLSADRVVVTAGAWVLRLFPQLAGTLVTYRTAVVYLEPPADFAPAWEASPVILDVGGRTDGYIIPASGGGGLKFGSGLHKERLSDANAGRVPRQGEGEAVRDLFTPPFVRLGQYKVIDTVTCAYTFTADERFFGAEIGRTLVVSACSGHGYKFGAAVGRRVADAVETGDAGMLKRWLRAEA